MLGRALGVLDDDDKPRGRRRRRGRKGRRRRRRADDVVAPELDDEEEFSAEPEGELEELADLFRHRTGIRLHHRGDDDGGGAEKGPVELALARRALPTLQEVLMVYPEPIRGHLLKDLHIYGRFIMRGKPFLGCALPKKQRINLAVRTRTRPASLKTTMHHEIAHLIENHRSFPTGQWVEISDGLYTGRGHRDDEGKANKPELLAKGFVTRYASRNRHEDFAELAEVAFTKPRRMLRWAEQHDAIARKLDIATDVYERIAPDLDLPWTD